MIQNMLALKFLMWNTDIALAWDRPRPVTGWSRVPGRDHLSLNWVTFGLQKILKQGVERGLARCSWVEVIAGFLCILWYWVDVHVRAWTFWRGSNPLSPATTGSQKRGFHGSPKIDKLPLSCHLKLKFGPLVQTAIFLKLNIKLASFFYNLPKTASR